jgi:lipooligosaccharide transport system permease protein
LPLRIVPPALLEARRPQRMLERQQMLIKSGGWTILVSGFFEPLFYLLSIRVGFGVLIGDVVDGDQIIEYAVFVAPALMAASAMNGAIFESTMNIFFKLKYQRTYDAILATPLTVGDVALGEIGYATIRGSIYSAAFLVTMAALGMAPSWWSLLTVPICVLISFAFSAVGMMATTFMRSWSDFEYVPTITLPLFLFSATFYPVSSYGDWAWVVQLSPLYHGVALVRGVTQGQFSWTYLVHIAVLVAMAVVGLLITAKRLVKMLLP